MKLNKTDKSLNGWMVFVLIIVQIAWIPIISLIVALKFTVVPSLSWSWVVYSCGVWFVSTAAIAVHEILRIYEIRK